MAPTIIFTLFSSPVFWSAGMSPWCRRVWLMLLNPLAQTFNILTNDSFCHLAVSRRCFPGLFVTLNTVAFWDQPWRLIKDIFRIYFAGLDMTWNSQPSFEEKDVAALEWTMRWRQFYQNSTTFFNKRREKNGIKDCLARTEWKST